MSCNIEVVPAKELTDKEAQQVDTFIASLSEADKYVLAAEPENVVSRVLNGYGVTSRGEPVTVTKVLVDGDTVSYYSEKGELDRVEVDGKPLSGSAAKKLLADVNTVMLEGEEFSTLATEVYNDPDKIVELGEQIDALDERSTDPKHRQTLLDTLKESAEYFKKALPMINVHINKHLDRTRGFINVSGNVADVAVSIGASGKSGLETYAHEIFHAATELAINSGDPELAGVRRRILQIRQEVITGVTAKEFAKYFVGYANPEKEAEAVLDYISNGKNSLHEFVVLSRTNKELGMLLKGMKNAKAEVGHKNMASRLAYWVKQLLDTMFKRVVTKEPKTDSAYEAMAWFTLKLMEANKKGLTAKKKATSAGLLSTLAKVDSRIKDYYEQKRLEYIANNTQVPAPGSGKWAKMLWMAKYAGRGLVDENVRKTWATTASMLGIKPEDVLQNLGRDMMGIGDKVSDLVEAMGLKSLRIDQARQMQHNTATKLLRDSFSRKLNNEEMEALWVLNEADVASLKDRSDFQELMGLGTRDKAITAAIREIEVRLEAAYGKEAKNYYKWQAEGLANYMATGEKSVVQLLNPHAIAHMINAKNPVREVSDELVKDIDELISLYGLKRVDRKTAETLDRLVTEEKEGVVYTLSHLQVIKEDSMKHLFNNGEDKFRYVKGYLKEVYPEEVETVTAPLAKEAELKKQGFKLVKEHESNSLVGTTIKMGYYVNALPVKPRLHKVGFRYTDNKMRGQSLRDMYYKEDSEVAIALAKRDTFAINDRVKDIVDQIMQGNYMIGKDEKGLLPLVSREGQVVDYRFTMNKADKVRYLGMSRDLLDVIGASEGSIVDKRDTPLHNKEMLKVVLKDMEENYIPNRLLGKNQEEYIWIGPKATDERLKELWYLLPDTVRSEMKEGFAVRRDLLLDTLGYREKSIVDAKWVLNAPLAIKYSIQTAEMVWKEVVKTVKSSVLLRMPVVLLNNVYSNFMYSIMNGYNPVEVARYQAQAVRELNEYIKDMKKGIELKVLVQTGTATEQQIRELGSLESRMKDSPISDLVDAGFFNQLTEEIEAGGDTGRLTKFFDKKLEGTPRVLRNGLDWLFLTEKTPVYQFMNTATQYSDFVARYAQYHMLRKDGMSKADAIVNVRNAFVNYNKANSPWLEYANQMGLVMFTKYFTRIQRVITELFKGHPLTAVLVLLGEHYLLADMSMVPDSSVVVKDLGNLFYNPLESLVTAVTPQGAVLAGKILM